MPNSRCSRYSLLLLALACWSPKVATAQDVNFGNFVWHDLDGDGVQDAGESGIPGVQVDLVTADRTVLVDSTITNASGIYTLVGPRPGAFRIRVHVPDGYEITRQNLGSDTADSDVAPFGPDYRYSDPILADPLLISATGIDVGLTQPNAAWDVGDFVWFDADGDGVQDGGESGLAGVQVELWNAPKTQRLAITTTNLLGVYSFAAPYPGLLRIRVIPPAGYQLSPSDADTDAIDSDVDASGPDSGFSEPFVAACCASLTQHDAGLMLPVNPVSIGNRVWEDVDGNGLQDGGEAGLAGVTVQLWNAAQTTLLGTDVTDASGLYTIAAQVPGGFRIRVLRPPGFFYTLTDAGGDDSDDSDVDSTTSNAGFTAPFWLGANIISATTLDAGLVDASLTATIGDYVWFDTDFDGAQDAGEPSVAGVMVEVWDAARTTLVDSTPTDVGGGYALTVPRPGQYRIHVPVVPSDGLQFTQKNVTTVSTDSDVHPWGPDYGFSDPIVISSIQASITSRDVGLLAQVIPEPAGALMGAAAFLGVAILARRSGFQRGVK